MPLPYCTETREASRPCLHAFLRSLQVARMSGKGAHICLIPWLLQLLLGSTPPRFVLVASRAYISGSPRTVTNRVMLLTSYDHKA